MHPLLYLTPGLADILLIPFVLLPLVLWVWALLDLLKSSFRSGSEKLIWLVVVVFIPLLGPLLYIFIGRKQKVNYLN